MFRGDVLMIEASSVSFSYPNGRKVLKDISFHISEGDSVAILGSNGSGKSTLLKLITSLNHVTDGNLSVAGIDADSERNLREIRRHIAYVFQNPDACFVEDKVLEDAMFTPIAYGVDEVEARDLALKSLDRFGVLDKSNRTIATLSGGEKERCILSSVSSLPKDIYVFDEVLTFLDGKARETLLSIIGKLKEDGKTIIFVTHDTEEALQFDRTMLLSGGRIIRYGETREVLSDIPALEEAGVRRTKAMDIYLSLKERGVELSSMPFGKEELCSLLRK